ncbi:LOW QUALITY PROTEIN: hypothetical protein Cgig2_022607 [Carnegiea gigantea]|uniref:Uncharacterized protein n=1 Tax=Carnegiea gigantea TaxID=171969 RepID=A0A9Q1GWR9_9CARY|nr:LOW QUALITY PROTEIN: hypothetical protein Cgig2_022607 [Carnegiea gigantea]
MMQQLSNAAVQKGHISDVEPFNSLDSEENDLTYECEEVDHENKLIKAKEEVAISNSALVLVRATSSGKELQIVQKDLVLKSEGNASKKSTYSKAFIMRMSMRSFLSLVAQLNKAQAEAVRSIGFAPFLKVDVQQILGKFSKWLLDLYAICFRLPDGQRFPVTAFDVHATLGVPLGDQKSSKSRSLQSTMSMTRVHFGPKDGGESFKRNFIIYLVNCFFSKPKNCYSSKSISKYLKDVSQITSLDWCQFVVDKLITSIRHYKESTAAKGKVNNNLYAPSFSPTVPLDKLDGEAEISETHWFPMQESL